MHVKLLAAETFNRTSLELKQSMWNSTCLSARTFNRTSLELKPLWMIAMLSSTSRSFNRTSLELKPFWGVCQVKKQKKLLIEPVWNWNIIGLERPTYIELAFNRTSLELKPCRVRRICRRFHLLIEPVWNWNQRIPDRCHRERRGF